MSTAWSQLLGGLAARRRRSLIRALLAQADIRELSWLPPQGSPLHHGDSTVKLAMDQVIGPRTLAFGHWHDEHCALLRAPRARTALPPDRRRRERGPGQPATARRARRTLRRR
ncbi:MAG: hypothetical protein IPH76_19230 [Xanthomonadales bacterium]|nr:hypothetical protein [Xanthomonadales bacterium]